MRPPIITLETLDRAFGPNDAPELESLDAMLERGEWNLPDAFKDQKYPDPFDAAARAEEIAGHPLALSHLYQR